MSQTTEKAFETYVAQILITCSGWKRAIAAYLDALVGKVEAALEQLQEYRTALITANVTGKIDVRRAVPKASSTTPID